MLISPTLASGETRHVLRQLVDALRNKLTIRDNLQSVVVNVVSPATPGMLFTVSHNLGKIPTAWIANPQDECYVWSVNIASWTDKEIFLAASAASIPLRVVLLL